MVTQFPSTNPAHRDPGVPDVAPAATELVAPPRLCAFAPGSRGTRVLVVEDDASVRKFIVQVLKCSGYDVSEAGDGEDGWEALRTDSFQLLLTDNFMPRLNGVELIERLRGAGMLVPVVLASGSLPWDDAGAPPELRPVVTLAKPYGAGDLLAKIEACLLTAVFLGGLQQTEASHA